MTAAAVVVAMWVRMVRARWVLLMAQLGAVTTLGESAQELAVWEQAAPKELAATATQVRRLPWHPKLLQ